MNRIAKSAVIAASLLALSAPAFAAPTAPAAPNAATPSTHAVAKKKSVTTSRASSRAPVSRQQKSH